MPYRVLTVGLISGVSAGEIVPDDHPKLEFVKRVYPQELEEVEAESVDDEGDDDRDT